MAGKQIPKDEERSGNRDSDCRAVVYGATREEVEKKIADYFRRYPPQGYGTIASLIVEHFDGYYYSHLRRYHSCD